MLIVCTPWHRLIAEQDHKVTLTPSVLGFWTDEPRGLGFDFQLLGFFKYLVKIGGGKLSLKFRACCKYLKSESICKLLYFRNSCQSWEQTAGLESSPVKLRRLAWLLIVQGAWTSSLTTLRSSSHVLYFIRHYGPFPLGSSSRFPTHSRVGALTSNEHFCGVHVFTHGIFLHYTLCGPPWHPIQVIITSEEWYKRDLPLKAFLWYLTAVHQTLSFQWV